MTRTLASPFDAVAASVETAGGASTASVIVYADCPSCNGEPPLVDDHFKEKKVGAETPPPPAGAPPVRCAACCTFEQDKTESHTVQSGEWLSTIALRHYQTLDWSRIYDANRKVLRNRHPDRIFPGQRLKIPLCDSR
jgi:nucleoid-associated protein YgaU